jgi:hypothetical protein
MNVLQSILTVLHHEKPDRIPFVPNEDLLPRGELTRELRNRGMGMSTAWTPTFWSGCPNVRVQTQTAAGVTTTTWVTPHGSVSRRQGQADPEEGEELGSGIEQAWIERAEDYAPVCFALQDETFYRDDIAYAYKQYDLGGDCLIKLAGPCIPYEASYTYFESGTPEGLARWRAAQDEQPELFEMLLDALAQREKRRWKVLSDAPGEVVCVEGLSDRCTPEAFRRHVLPFLQDCVARLHAQDKVVCLKTSCRRLSAWIDLIPEAGVDVIDGFCPPPGGDLAVAEARAAWGADVVFWIDFPTQLFAAGAGQVKQYTRQLIESDPSGALVLGLTTRPSVTYAASTTGYRAFASGMRAILDAATARTP